MASQSPHPGLAGNQEFTFSQSSLQDYADCPRRFQLRYLDRLVWPSVEAEPVSEGEGRQRDALLFHRMVQQHLLGTPSHILGAMRKSADLGRWWANYVDASPSLAGFSLHPEQGLAAYVDDYRLVAKYDLVAIRSGSAEIYDWKTHARKPPAERLAARWQTRIYRAMLVRAGAELNGGRALKPREVTMVYWFAEFPSETVRLAYDENQYQRDWAALGFLIQEIAAAHQFPMTEDRSRCRFCVYRSLCDRGTQAGPLQELDDELSEQPTTDADLGPIAELGS